MISDNNSLKKKDSKALQFLLLFCLLNLNRNFKKKKREQSVPVFSEELRFINLFYTILPSQKWIGDVQNGNNLSSSDK